MIFRTLLRKELKCTLLNNSLKFLTFSFQNLIMVLKVSFINLEAIYTISIVRLQLDKNCCRNDCIVIIV